MRTTDVDQQLSDLTALADPVRRALYRHVVEHGAAVGRDEAAAAVGISRALAAYHLDKLVEDGLLQTRFQRRSGRRGPGAGRPAKLYLQSGRQLELSLPPRDYAALAELLAGAVQADPSGSARAALHSAAHALGAQLGAEASGRLPGRGAPPAAGEPPAPGAPAGRSAPALEAIRRVLTARGYQPYEDPDGTLRLANCPFDRIAERHPELVCGANLAMLQGIVEELGDHGVRPLLDPAPGRCCVVLATTRPPAASPEPAAGRKETS
jgi:predicted ArsR family transcriptional regulator